MMVWAMSITFFIFFAVLSRATTKPSSDSLRSDAFYNGTVEIDKSLWRYAKRPSSLEGEALVCFLGHSFNVIVPGQIAYAQSFQPFSFQHH